MNKTKQNSSASSIIRISLFLSILRDHRRSHLCHYYCCHVITSFLTSNNYKGLVFRRLLLTMNCSLIRVFEHFIEHDGKLSAVTFFFFFFYFIIVGNWYGLIFCWRERCAIIASGQTQQLLGNVALLGVCTQEVKKKANWNGEDNYEQCTGASKLKTIHLGTKKSEKNPS